MLTKHRWYHIFLILCISLGNSFSHSMEDAIHTVSDPSPETSRVLAQLVHKEYPQLHGRLQFKVAAQSCLRENPSLAFPDLCADTLLASVDESKPSTIYIGKGFDTFIADRALEMNERESYISPFPYFVLMNMIERSKLYAENREKSTPIPEEYKPLLINAIKNDAEKTVISKFTTVNFITLVNDLKTLECDPRKGYEFTHQRLSNILNHQLLRTKMNSSTIVRRDVQKKIRRQAT
jgi:hypothetical protein